MLWCVWNHIWNTTWLWSHLRNWFNFDVVFDLFDWSIEDNLAIERDCCTMDDACWVFFSGGMMRPAVFFFFPLFFFGLEDDSSCFSLLFEAAAVTLESRLSFLFTFFGFQHWTLVIALQISHLYICEKSFSKPLKTLKMNLIWINYRNMIVLFLQVLDLSFEFYDFAFLIALLEGFL